MKEELEFGPVKYPGTNDYVAKKIWSNPTNLKNLVYITLGITLDETKIEYTSNEDKKEITAKGNEYDVIVKYGDDITMLVETQNYGNDNSKEYSNYIINRSIHYIASTHCKLYKEGDRYQVNKYTYLIWVTTFATPDNEGISVFSFSNGKIVFDRLKIVFVSLPNIKKDAKINLNTKDFFGVLESNDLSCYQSSNEEVISLAKVISDVNKSSDEAFLAELAHMRKMAMLTEIELGKEQGYSDGKAIGYSEGIKEGFSQGKEEGFSQGKEEGFSQGKEEGFSQGKEEGFSQGKEEGFSQGKEEGFSQGKEEGFSKGKQQGIEEGRLNARNELVLNLYKNNMDVDTISKYTGIEKSIVEDIVLNK